MLCRALNGLKTDATNVNLDTLILLIAFGHRIKEPAVETGLLRFQEIVERTIKGDDF